MNRRRRRFRRSLITLVKKVVESIPVPEEQPKPKPKKKKKKKNFLTKTITQS